MASLTAALNTLDPVGRERAGRILDETSAPFQLEAKLEELRLHLVVASQSDEQVALLGQIAQVEREMGPRLPDGFDRIHGIFCRNAALVA